MDRQAALAVVFAAIDVVNGLRKPEDAIARKPDVLLAGEGGPLDSLAIITMALSIERKVAELTGQEVSLLDENDFESQIDAFRTPSTIANLVLEKLNG
jgi:hypothetical protein